MALALRAACGVRARSCAPRRHRSRCHSSHRPSAPAHSRGAIRAASLSPFKDCLSIQSYEQAMSIHVVIPGLPAASPWAEPGIGSLG